MCVDACVQGPAHTRFAAGKHLRLQACAVLAVQVQTGRDKCCRLCTMETGRPGHAMNSITDTHPLIVDLKRTGLCWTANIP